MSQSEVKSCAQAFGLPHSNLSRLLCVWSKMRLQDGVPLASLASGVEAAVPATEQVCESAR